MIQFDVGDITSRKALELGGTSILPTGVAARVFKKEGADTCIPDGAIAGSSGPGEAMCIGHQKVAREHVV